MASRPKTLPSSWKWPSQQFTTLLISIRSLATLKGNLAVEKQEKFEPFVL